MNPLIITLTFLMLLGILTSSELLQHANDAQTSRLLQARICKQNLENDSLQTIAFEELKKEQSDTPKHRTDLGEKPEPQPSPTEDELKSVDLRYNLERPPNNSRLNFYLVLHEEDSTYSTFAVRLMRRLYRECSFYVPHCEQRILDALIAHREQTSKMKYADELASVDLGDRTLQEIFYHMLKGSEGPSLLNYITFDEPTSRTERKINFLFAKSELIEVIFEGSGLHPQIEQIRARQWEEILEATSLGKMADPLTRTKIKQALVEDFESLLAGTSSFQDLKKLFDFTLGKSGNILYIKNPISGELTRTKVIKRA